jgi:hypothetical protein
VDYYELEGALDFIRYGAPFKVFGFPLAEKKLVKRHFDMTYNYRRGLSVGGLFDAQRVGLAVKALGKFLDLRHRFGVQRVHFKGF